MRFLFERWLPASASARGRTFILSALVIGYCRNRVIDPLAGKRRRKLRWGDGVDPPQVISPERRNGMEEKISIRKNALDVAEMVVSLLCLVGVVVYLILAWGNIPDRIPGHYNALGEVDHWSSKTSLIMLPIISWMLFGFITLVERYPQIWNTGITLTEANRDEVYRLLKSMIALVKMFVLLMFASLTVLSSFAFNLPIWYILGFLMVVFGTIAVCIVRLNRLRQG